MAQRYAYIEPKTRRSAQGRRLVINVNGRREERTKAKGTAFIFQILKKRDGTLNSGLEYFVPNEWHEKKEENVKLPSNWRGSDIWKRETITRQEQLELSYNKPPGFLTNIPEVEKDKYTYLQTFMYRLEDTQNVVDLSTLKGEVFLEAAKASPRVADSADEALYDLNARFYISSVNEAIEKKSSIKELAAEATTNLTNLKNKSGTIMLRKVAVVLGLVTTQTNAHFIYNALFDFINEDKKKIAENCTKFNRTIDLLSSPTKRRVFNAEYLLRELVNYGVVAERLGAFYWKSQEGTSLDCIGKTKQTAIGFISDKGNEIHVEALQKELNNIKSL
jgi:cell division protein ZapA (FtsZ GTPase activity inhibitor)